MILAVFDDATTQFYPASINRSVGDIRCGILKLRQRLQALLYSDEDAVFVEGKLKALYLERHPDWKINQASGDVLFVNSRIRLSTELIKHIRNLTSSKGIKDKFGNPVAFRVQLKEEITNLEQLVQAFDKVETEEMKATLYDNVADLINDSSRMIEFDYEQFFHDSDNFIETELGVTILNPYNVWIGENVIMRPGVVIDATHGPVVIDEEAELMPHSVVMGPVYIGKKTRIKIGAKIYAGTSIGPICKIGGEIENSIIQAYSNKQHDGFLGHAYLGEWVNIGAGTNNSDLKNNYKPVSFYSYSHKTKVNTDYQFLGSIIGDHTKTGINCTLNTGVVIGMGCNLWGTGLITDFISSFSWGESGKIAPYNFDSFIQTTEVVKKRRNLTLSNNEIELYRNIWHSEH